MTVMTSSWFVGQKCFADSWPLRTFQSNKKCTVKARHLDCKKVCFKPIPWRRPNAQSSGTNHGQLTADYSKSHYYMLSSCRSYSLRKTFPWMLWGQSPLCSKSCGKCVVPSPPSKLNLTHSGPGRPCSKPRRMKWRPLEAVAKCRNAVPGLGHRSVEPGMWSPVIALVSCSIPVIPGTCIVKTCLQARAVKAELRAAVAESAPHAARCVEFSFDPDSWVIPELQYLSTSSIRFQIESV